MISHLNRVLEVYRNWEHEEGKLKVLDGLQPNGKGLLQVKYDFLCKGMYRVKVNPSVGEALALGVMKGILAKMEEQIYPNRLLRVMHQLKVALVDKPNYLDRFQKFKEENLKQVDSLLKSKGFDHYFGELEQHLDYERPTVYLDFTASLNANINIGFRINMKKNSKGGYEMESLQTTVKHAGQPERDRHFEFDKDFDINAAKAVNLLMGRAVLNGTGDFNHDHTNQWIQLENVNASDQYGIKVFQAEQGFDLKRALNDFATETGIYKFITPDVMVQLQNGHQVKLARQGPDQPIFLEAHPGTKAILIRDQKQNIIRADKLFLKDKQVLEKEHRSQWMISPENLDKSNQQDHSLGIGS